MIPDNFEAGESLSGRIRQTDRSRETSTLCNLILVTRLQTPLFRHAAGLQIHLIGFIQELHCLWQIKLFDFGH